MYGDRVGLLLGASFAVGYNQFFEALVQVVQIVLTISPRGVAALLAKLAVGLFVMCCAVRKKAPVRNGFIAAAGYEARACIHRPPVAAVFFASLTAALAIKAAVEDGMSTRGIIIEIVIAFVGPTTVLIGYTAVLVATWLALPPTSAKAPAKGVAYWRSFWLGATACIMFELAVLGLTNVAIMSTMPVPPKPGPFKVLYIFMIAMFVVQALLAPVGLYGALATNKACLIAALALTVAEVLEYMVVFVLYVLLLIPTTAGASEFVAATWLVAGTRLLGAVIVAATAYKYTVAPGDGGNYRPMHYKPSAQ